MGISFSGDFQKLAVLKRKIDHLFKLREQIIKGVAAEALAQTQLGFREERDPDGQKWAPLKKRVGQILSLTGRLRRSFHLTVTSGGFRIGTNVKYAKYHQGGTKFMPMRRMLPANGSLGKRWEGPIHTAARNVLLKYWGRK